MRCLAIWALIGSLSGCDAPPPEPALEPAPPQVHASQAKNQPSLPQLRELSEQCGKSSREVFQREWKDAIAQVAGGQASVDFTNHYNARLDACFYQLTLSHAVQGQRKLLFELSEREPYGEFLGQAGGFPEVCRVEHLYCASSGEWDVLAAPYLED